MLNKKFEKKLVNRGCGTHYYEVKNTEGMTKEEILDACDCNNFGGTVYGNTVAVYVD